MSERNRQLIGLLADGRFHSGEALAGVLGVSRAAVWKRLQSLAQTFGLEIQAVRGRGYRLARPIELLSLSAIEQRIRPARRAQIGAIELFDSLPSTSQYLADGVARWGSQRRACFAERQTHGRGRRGRLWISPFGANLYLSLYWRFDLPMAALNGLSLGAGVGVVRALERAGLGGASLKWPNDIHYDEKKLGGILVEVLGQTEGPVSSVIGVGVNVDMPEASGRQIDQDWIDLRRALRDIEGVRNRLAGLLLDELVGVAQAVERGDWPELYAAWREFDAYVGRDVVVHTPGGTESGVYLGVDGDGALLLRSGSETRVFHAGEVSLRTVGGETG